MPDALKTLEDDLARVAFVPGAEASADYQALLDRCRRLLEVKVAFEARRPAGAPPFVVMAGGTNVGKSTVFNWVIGEPVASSSPLARHTKAPTLFVHAAALDALCNGALLPRYARLVLERPDDAAREAGDRPAYFLRTHEREGVQGVVLVDAPDIDSTSLKNHGVAEDLLFLADAVVFVATPEKYNDELCVRFLRQAAELKRTLVCVLNKGADEEVARDFREGVIAGLGAEATVLTLPYVGTKPDPRADQPFLPALRGAVLRPGRDLQAIRAAARRGATVTLGGELQRVVSRLREELSELDRVRSEVELACDARRDEYARFLHKLDFYELDYVFERVLEYFKVPVIDHVYDGVRGAFSFVSAGLGRLVSGKAERDPRAERQAQRAELDRQKVKELIEGARADAVDLPRQLTASLRGAADGWVAGLDAPSVEATNAEVTRFLEASDAAAQAWIEAQTRRHVEVLEQHPYARNTLRAVKAVLQVGLGVTSAYLTGGLAPGHVDALLIAPAVERATKALIEKTGGVVHYQALKAEFVQERARLFRALLARTVADPLAGRVPHGVDPERLERLDAAAAALRRGEVPA